MTDPNHPPNPIRPQLDTAGIHIPILFQNPSHFQPPVATTAPQVGQVVFGVTRRRGVGVSSHGQGVGDK